MGSALSEENNLKIINCSRFIGAWRAVGICFENKTGCESLCRRLNSYRISSANKVSVGVSEMRGKVHWYEATNGVTRSLVKNEVLERVTEEVVTKKPIGSR